MRTNVHSRPAKRGSRRRRAAEPRCALRRCTCCASSSRRRGRGPRDDRDPGPRQHHASSPSTILSSRSCARSNVGAISSAASACASPRRARPAQQIALGEIAVCRRLVGRPGRQRGAEPARGAVGASLRCSACRPSTAVACASNGSSSTTRAAGRSGARSASRRAEQRRQLAGGFDVVPSTGEQRFERLDRARRVARFSASDCAISACGLSVAGCRRHQLRRAFRARA